MEYQGGRREVEQRHQRSLEREARCEDGVGKGKLNSTCRKETDG